MLFLDMVCLIVGFAIQRRRATGSQRDLSCVDLGRWCHPKNTVVDMGAIQK
jgi:hypothetical protein